SMRGMRRASAMLVLLAGCARGIVDENEGAITNDEPPSTVAERPPARRVSADAPVSLPERTPSASFVDPEGDVTTPDAADIVRVSVAQAADFMLELVVETKGSGHLDLYIDSDLLTATGVDGFDVRASASDASSEVELWFHEGGTWRAVDAPSFRGSFSDG